MFGGGRYQMGALPWGRKNAMETTMSARVLVLGAFAALALITAPQVQAADLDGEGYAPEGAAPYDGNGYADPGPGFEEPYAPREREGEEDYGQGAESWREAEQPPAWDDAPPYARGSLKDGYLAPMPRPPRFAEAPYGPRRCVPRWQIRQWLRADGWSDLRPLDRRGEIVVLRAERRDTGARFRLKVDRCTGEIVHAAPERWRTYGAYAPPPRFRYGY